VGQNLVGSVSSVCAHHVEVGDNRAPPAECALVDDRDMNCIRSARASRFVLLARSIVLAFILAMLLGLPVAVGLRDWIGGPGMLRADGFVLTVELSGFRSDKGAAVVLLYDNADAFPTKSKLALSKQRVSVIGGLAKVEFPNLKAGDYAVAAFHDINDNRKMDTNFLGIPKEPIGVSNDAKGRMGPPSFKDAKFAVSGSQTVRITIK